jgi:hypothetical protein
MELIQIIILIFSIFALSRVFLNIKNKNLDNLEIIFWTLFWTLSIIISIFPNLISIFSNTFGIERGIDLIIYLTIISLSYLIFRLYAKIHSMEKDITKIIRKIAIKNEKT